ncbi:MAG TPA: SRPBCC family protein [Candidatus Angelobacter sp.]|nr:SRPBCC family protein [Candidatus Angelobacter sp.]
MRSILRSPAPIAFLILAIPVVAIAYTAAAGSQPRAQYRWFLLASEICVGGFIVLLGIAALRSRSRRDKPLDERALERDLGTILLGVALAIDAFALLLAIASPAIGLAISAVAAAWVLLWSIPRLRRTRFTTSYEIHCSPEVVFAFIADKRNQTKWWSEYDSVELLTTEPIGRGARFREHGRTPPDGKEFVADDEILDFEPSRRMTSRVVTDLHPNGSEYTFDPIGSSTRVTYRFDFEHSLVGAALGARLLHFIATDLQKVSHERAQVRIRQILEDGGSGA